MKVLHYEVTCGMRVATVAIFGKYSVPSLQVASGNDGSPVCKFVTDLFSQIFPIMKAFFHLSTRMNFSYVYGLEPCFL